MSEILMHHCVLHYYVCSSIIIMVLLLSHQNIHSQAFMYRGRQDNVEAVVSHGLSY